MMIYGDAEEFDGSMDDGFEEADFGWLDLYDGNSVGYDYYYDDGYGQSVAPYGYTPYETGGVVAYEWMTTAPRQVDLMTVGVVALVVVIALGLWLDGRPLPIVSAPPIPISLPHAPEPIQPTAVPLPEPVVGPATIIVPYDSYVLTQGLHGFSYGHMAIDLKAGKGAMIKSPIEGTVSALYIDEIGNPTLVIENEYYQVTLMHGEYTVTVGESLKLGQPVGTESNLGNTKDWAGNSCRGRDCGYHTHLNVFDKRLGMNVSPLDLLHIPGW